MPSILKIRETLLRFLINIKKRFVFHFSMLCAVCLLLLAVDKFSENSRYYFQDYLYGLDFLGLPIDAEYPHSWSDMTWAHAVLDNGLERAKADILKNEVKYYFYGLTSPKMVDGFTNILLKNDIHLNLRGCEIGTPKHQQDMLYNKYIQNNVPLDIESILVKLNDNEAEKIFKN